MENPIKICKFYKPGNDATFCRDCGICVGYCSIDQQECNNPLLRTTKTITSKIVCPRHNRTEDELDQAVSKLTAMAQRR